MGLAKGSEMKKLGLALVLMLSLSTPPAESFLNRDCGNLKKRTIANQKLYDKAWDKYQTAYAKWQAISNTKQKFQNPVAVNRLRATFQIAEGILQDLNKFPKCLNSASYARIPMELGLIKNAYKDLDGNLGFALFNNYLSSPIDYRKYLKD